MALNNLNHFWSETSHNFKSSNKEAHIKKDLQYVYDRLKAQVDEKYITLYMIVIVS